MIAFVGVAIVRPRPSLDLSFVAKRVAEFHGGERRKLSRGPQPIPWPIAHQRSAPVKSDVVV